MNGLLVRVGADLSPGGGSWNGPIDGETGQFLYVAIPESGLIHAGLEKPYSKLAPALSRFSQTLPGGLANLHMHLDPDFDHLTYGDQGEKAKQLQRNLAPGDFIVFYAGLANVRRERRLVYALIGFFIVQDFVLAVDVSPTERDMNAHSRRVLKPGANDLIVRAKPGLSGRLRRALDIGEYRDRAYRVRREILDRWGGLSVKDGYLQRSARLPKFCNPERFLSWFHEQSPELLSSNN